MKARPLTALGAVALAMSCSCEDKTTVGAAGQGGKSAASSSVWVSAQSSTAGGAPPKPEPCPDWPGWETWDDFAATCPFCVPASKDALPEPIVWEACDPRAGMPVGCRTMKVTWPVVSSPFAVVFSGDVVKPEKVVLRFTRLSGVEPRPYLMHMVAEADGTSLSAFIDTRSYPEGCAVYSTDLTSLRHGKTIFKIWRFRDFSG